MPNLMRGEIRSGDRCGSRCLTIAILMVLLFIMIFSGLFVLQKVHQEENQGNISENVRIIEEGPGQAMPQAIVKSLLEKAPNERQAIYTGSDHKVFWIWVPVELLTASRVNHQFMLYADHPNFVQLEAYWVSEKGALIEPVQQDLSLIYPFWVMPSQSEMTRQEGMLVRVETIVNAFKLCLVPSTVLYSLQNWLVTYMLFNIGIIFGVFILDIALTLILSERAFMWHAIFLAFAQLYMYTSNGLNRISIGMSGYGFFGFGFLTIFAAMAFTDWFLKFDKRLPRMHLINQIAAVFNLVLALLSLLLAQSPPAVMMLYKCLALSGVVASVWVIAAVVTLLKSRTPVSFYFITGTCLQAVTIPILVYGIAGGTTFSTVYKLLYMLAGSINAVYFTLGIVHELRDVRTENAVYFKLATTDRLTGLHNRHYFDLKLQHKLSDIQDPSKVNALVIMDLDYFKRVNDTYGHPCGDEVLKTLAQILQRHLSEDDTACRWGGEEFAVLLSVSHEAEALQWAEQLRKAVERHKFETVGSLTVSLGVSIYQCEETYDKWFKRTDDYLYQAKDHGRNRVKGAYYETLHL